MKLMKQKQRMLHVQNIISDLIQTYEGWIKIRENNQIFESCSCSDKCLQF